MLVKRLSPIYEQLHKHPEVSWKEVHTTTYIVEFLKSIGLDPIPFENMTGLYVDIGKGIPRVGFRTDMDALWQKVDGVFQANHSCGHDAHMTVAIGAILLLKEMESTLSGAVRIIFQPAEEKAQGAIALVKLGVVDELEFLFGTHVRPIVELEDGKFAPALQHGAAKLISGEVTGVEAHGARPELGVNAIEVAAALVAGMKGIWINPSDSGSIKMTQLQAGGSATNIIPANASFSIDVRAQNNETMDELTRKFDKIVQSLRLMYNAEIDYQVDAHIAAAQVNGEARDIMKQAIIDVVGEDNCTEEIVTPGGEDFHFYNYSRPKIKTTMLGIGCGVYPGLHHPDMTLNTERLPVAARIITKAVLLALEHAERSDANG